MARRTGIVDRPSTPRKIHTKAVPLLGGAAIFGSFFVLLGLVRIAYPDLFAKMPDGLLWGVFFGACVLMVGGYLDDRYTLAPRQQILFPIVAATVVMLCGLRVVQVTAPAGGVLPLGAIVGIPLTFLWLMGMMYTTKLLDGIDGLATGIVGIGAVMIFALTQTARFFQPDVGVLAILLFGSCLGFLFFNSYPAKIFLGEGGSVLLGFLLGILAIISGSKIATTLLVMGIPILDVALVMLHRLWHGKPITHGDDRHLHYRLLHKGFSQRTTALFLYALSAAFGMMTLFLQSRQKIIALFVLVFVMLLLSWYLVWGSSDAPKSGNR